MKSFTKLTAAFLNGDEKGRYKRYHINGDWLVANLRAGTRPMVWRRADCVYAANPHERTARAFGIFMSMAGAKRPRIRACLVGRNLLACVYGLDRKNALPASGAEQDALIEAAMTDLAQKIGGFMAARDDYTLALLDIACGTRMKEQLLAAWRRRGWEFIATRRLLHKVREFQGRNVEKRWLQFRPAHGGEEALSMLWEAHYALRLRRHLRRQVSNDMSVVSLHLRALDGDLVTMRLRDIRLPELVNTEALSALRRRAVPVAQAALLEALRRRDWKAGVFRKLARLMRNVLVDTGHLEFKVVADAEEFGVKLEEMLGFTLSEEALEGVYNVVRLLAKMENASKEVGDA